jgi:hypothetical protein
LQQFFVLQILNQSSGQLEFEKKKNSHNSKFLDNIVLVKTCNLTIMKTDCLAIKISKDYLAKENAWTILRGKRIFQWLLNACCVSHRLSEIRSLLRKDEDLKNQSLNN